jgi:hypothetical protein
MQLPPYITKLSAPNSSQSSSSNETYDYQGADDLVKRQDAVAGLRDSKFKALYGGDIPSSVEAASRIRSLLDTIRAHDPLATELKPVRYITPLSRLASTSSSGSSSSDGMRLEGVHSEDKSKS